MRTFYVRPQSEGGYGRGDGSSYDNAWNGIAAVDWRAMAAAEPAQLWVCGPAETQGGFVCVFVEWSYLESAPLAA